MARALPMWMLSVCLLVFSGWAQARGEHGGNWEKLASKNVGILGDRDSIHVNRGPYNKLRLSVHKRAVQFSRVFVEFRNGDRIEVPVRERIHAGGQSRVIDLPGRGRYIKKVILWYKTAPGTLERAQVAVWARR
ncbi:hypothetical protein [Chitinibacter sp. ZOR0017]|uniref:hypothetical protein n=1 Tax=Chitinibacter sp. ZOR0017 TaxID=1339254 RepID=UPI0006462ED8|nr:hypothetical protein [Chitinibacter sp. ZOR0017]